MPAPPPRLVPLAEVDPAAVEALLDAAFGADRRRRTAYRIRDGMAALASLSFAALDGGGGLLGTLQCWPVALDGAVPLTLVGPVAVDAAHRRAGVGRRMMAHALGAADAAAADPQVLIGDPEYYGRFFGFEERWTRGWTVPGPVERRRLLARVPPGARLPVAGHLGPRGPQAAAPLASAPPRA